jgi:uncharacterized protein (TIGR00297 family)
MGFRAATADRKLLRRNDLPRTAQFRAVDILALAFAAALMGIFLLTGFPQLLTAPGRTLISLGITVAFAFLAWQTHGVNLSGALAGSAIAFILAAREFRMFCLLLVVFVITLAATRLGTRRKQQLRIAEPADGRSASQVMANLGVAGLIVALAPAGWTVLALAALAEAAADTSSSEIGLAFSGKTFLITTWKPVAPGVDGGISIHGTIAAVAAAAGVALAAKLTGLVPAHHAAAIVYAGFLGSLLDSLLGALLERRGYLSNDLVNLLSTAAAAGIAWILM